VDLTAAHIGIRCQRTVQVVIEIDHRIHGQYRLEPLGGKEIETVVRVAWGQGPIIGPDFSFVMLRGQVYSSYISAYIGWTVAKGRLFYLCFF
jgi:hypothetical protein